MGLPLKAGDPAPRFEGFTTDGTRVSLKDFRGRKLVMYFYPRDDTPGCTKQACSLRDHNAEIAAKGAAFEQAPHLVATMPDHELWMAFLRDSEGNLLALMEEKRPA